MNKGFARTLRIGAIVVLPLGMTRSVLVAQAASTVLPAGSRTCSTVAACIFATNTAAGPGIEGVSASGFGVEGISTSGRAVSGVSLADDGVVGSTAENATTASTGKAGVAGYDKSTNKNTFNSGVYGASDYADGVQGRSAHGPGVVGLSTEGGVGVFAASGPTRYTGFSQTGIVGQSATGDGIIGIGNTTGVVGFASYDCANPKGNGGPGCTSVKEVPSGAALTAGTDIGGLGLEIYTDANPNEIVEWAAGVGEQIDAGNIGLVINPARNFTGNPGLIVNGAFFSRGAFPAQGAIIAGQDALSVTGSDIGLAATGYQAIVAQAPPGGGSMLFSGMNDKGAAVANLDDGGNLVLAGHITSKGTITNALRNADGSYRAAYDTHSTLPAIEDMGEASLVSGAAFVPIDAALSKSIDVSHGYLVFLTPQGATSGLYVSGKSKLGFSVREIGNYHDSLTFDYRIVARPYGESGQRLAAVNASFVPGVKARPLFYRHLQRLRFSNGKVDPATLPKPSM